MWPSLLFGILLLLISAGLLLSHRQEARDASKRDLDERESDYLRRQRRRRNQASSMIGIIGFLVIGGIFVDGLVPKAIFWGLVVLLVFWMTALAFADLISTRVYYAHVRKEQLAEQAELYSELDRIREREANGRPRKD